MEEIKAGYENVRLQDGNGNKITSTGGALDIAGSISFAEEAVAADGGALPANVKVVAGYDGTNVQVIKTDANGKIQIDSGISSLIDAANSSSVNLSGGATFTGSFVEITSYASIQIGVYSNVNSATNGLVIQFSKDGSNVHHTHTYSYLASSNGLGYIFSPEFRYYRIVYTNGASAQSDFQLISILRSTALFPSQYRVSTAVTDETQALMTKSTIVGQTTGGGGGYVAVKVNPSGALTVDSTVSSSALPTGAATETTLQSINTHLYELDAAIVVDKSSFGGGDRIVVSGYVFDDVADAPALSENTASAARLNINRSQTGVIEDGGTRGRYATVTASNALKVDGSAVTQPVSFASMPLPTGAATEATLADVLTNLISVATNTYDSANWLSSLNGQTSNIASLLPSNLGQKTMANSLAVTLASDQSAVSVSQSGRTAVNLARIDYSSTNVTTGAYVQLLASTSAAVKEVEIFDSSGQTLVLATGGIGSESDKVYIFPGGNGRIPLSINASTRVAIKAVSATANAGEISVNFYS